MERVKLIALDLDGTLLMSDHETAPRENVEAIREAEARGVRVALSTGRMLEDAGDFARRLGIRCMIVSSNGARAADAPPPEGNVFLRRHFAPEDARRAIALLLEEGLIVNGFEDGLVTTADRGAGWVYHAAARGVIRAEYGEEALYAAAERGIMKLFAVARGESGEAEAARLARARERVRLALPHLTVSDSGPGISGGGNVEVMPPDTDKGSALAATAAYLGLSREEIMAVGDADNDVSMLRYAFHSVAMGNATDAVKAICRYTTATNDECGVARVIRRVLAAKEARK